MRAVKRKIKLSIACLLAVTFFAACAATATKTDEPQRAAQSNSVASNADESLNENSPQTSPAEAGKVRANETIVKIGESTVTEIELVIAEGYHVNANPASFDYLQPTELKVEKSDKLTVEKPIYPPAELKKFSFAEEPIAVYEKTAPIKFEIRANKNAKPGRIVLRGTLRSQPCNDSACFPPRSIEFSLPVQINP